MKKSPANVYIVSLGCPKNLVDTEVMTGALLSKGFGLTMDPEEADIYLVNTCAFIEDARQDAVDAIEEAVEWKEDDPDHRLVVVTGCLVQWDKENLVKREWPEVDLWTGLDLIPKLAEKVAEIQDSPAARGLTFRQDTPDFIYDEKMPRLKLTLPHLAYLKIAEGCNNRCSYCSIPSIRGGLRSRSMASIRQEALDLLDGGAKELIIIAQDTSAFGHDTKEGDLADLLRNLNAIDRDFQMRILYAHPAHLTDKIIDAMAECSKVLPYLDLPLQHIADPILKRMGRHVTTAQTEAVLQKLRTKIPGIAIRTTLITGFPGETEADFQQLKDFVKAQQFERLGVFAYCPETGTPAADFEPQVSEETGAARADEIMKIQGKISLKHNQGLVGKKFRVIIDEVSKKQAIGRTFMDAPEIDNTVKVTPPGQLQAGDLVEVRITGVSKYDLFAEPVKK